MSSSLNVTSLALQEDTLEGVRVYRVQSQIGQRRSLLGVSIVGCPFQLLPRMTYPAEYIEQGLLWQREFVKGLAKPPRISVCVFVNQETLGELVQFLESISVQSYPYREVVLVCERGVDIGEIGRLSETMLLEGVVVELHQQTSYGEALRIAIEYSSGDYLLLAQPRVLLHPYALFILGKEIVHKGPDYLYTNEVTVSEDLTTALEYFRKPPVDKYSLLSCNLLGSGFTLSKKLAQKLLKNSVLTEAENPEALAWVVACFCLMYGHKPGFIPLGLYLKRPNTTTSPLLPNSVVNALKAYATYLKLPAKRIEFCPDSFRLTAQPVLKPVNGNVQVVIPFRDKSELTIKCLSSLLGQDCLGELCITLVDNGSTEEELKLLKDFIEKSELKEKSNILSVSGYFNYAKLNNYAARKSSSDYIFFLNNDVELTTKTGISELKSWCALEDVGVVGGALYYEDGKMQHGGINFSGVRPINVTTPEAFVGVLRETNAVTFAMALIKREVFDEVSGLDEFICPNGFGDALFCKAVSEQGYKVIYTPFVKAIHRESASRGRLPEEFELYEMVKEGLSISDLYCDFEAKQQPTKLSLVSVPPDPIYRLAHELTSHPRRFAFVNWLAKIGLKILS